MNKTDKDFDQTLEIIEHSGLEDVIILHKNYRKIVNGLSDGDEKMQYTTLYNTSQKRLLLLEK